MIQTKTHIIICIFLALLVSPKISIKAQTVNKLINQATTLIEEEKYDEAYSILQSLKEKEVEICGDSCVMQYNYRMGACLYFMDRFEEAIPYLYKGLQIMEKLPHDDCEYFEMMYGIGSCYKEMGNYPKAEEYLRRVILKGYYFSIDCAIRNQTYSELAELYSIIGKPDLADICTSRIAFEMRFKDSENLNAQFDDLYFLYDAYKRQGKMEECISTLKSILSLIKEQRGKTNAEYLSILSILGYDLKLDFNRPDEAESVFNEIIEIGKQFKTYHSEVFEAYRERLYYLAVRKEVDSIRLLLPEVEKYYRLADVKPEEKISIYEIIGVELCNAGEYKDGVEFLEKEWNGKTANSIAALINLGQYYFHTDPAKAISYYKNAENQINNGLKLNDNVKQIIYENLMYLNGMLGYYDDAAKKAEMAEPFVLMNSDKDNHLSFLVLWAVYCVNAERIDKALELVGKAERIIEQATNEAKIPSYSNIGFVYLKSEKLDKAINIINKGIDLVIREKGEKYGILTTLYHNLGRAYMLKQEYADALSYLNKSKALQLELDGKVMERTEEYIKECLEK